MFQTPLVVRAREVLAVAQVYQPDLIVAEASGPVSILESERTVATAQWRLAQASLRGRPSAPERVSLVFDGLEIAAADVMKSGPLANAERIEFHVRRDPASAPDQPLFDFAIRAAGAKSPLARLIAQPIDAELTAVLRGLNDLSPKPFRVRLKELQQAGARLEVTNARLRQGNAIAAARGDLRLGASGRLDGAMTIMTAGFEGFVQDLIGGSAKARDQASAIAGVGLALLGQPAELDGRQAVALPLSFNNGTVFLGPVRLGQLPALY
jgi:hypothetical protein